jgi:LysR family transcriptional regulator of abg operon
MKLHHLRNVVAVVDRGSLRAGAKHLGLAQPAMSRSIKELEQELGVVLFQRNKFGMTLTAVGEIFVRRARGMMAELQRTLDEIEQAKGVDFGEITVAMSAAGHLALLPSMIGPFRRRFPNIRIKVVEGTFPMLETDIRDGLIDLYYGPVSKGFQDPALVVDLLFENARIIVGRRGHPLRNATRLDELVGASWVTTPVAIDHDSEVNSVFHAAGLPAPHIAMQAASSMSLLTIITASDLLAPLPQQWMEFIEGTNLIERLQIRDVPNAPRICAVRRANVPLTPAAEYLNDLAQRAAAIHVRKRAPVDLLA